jgi:pimeloyl-ACP methyl ester carboxylesterase
MEFAFKDRTIATNGIQRADLPVPAVPEFGEAVEQELPPSLDLCDQGRAVYFEEATHWVQHEEPEAVSRLLLEHFGG